MLTPEQIFNRKKGVGASEAAIVLGISSYMTPYQLWRIKIGLDESPDLSDQPQVHWGTILEEPIAQEYARRNNVKVRRNNLTLFHKQKPYMLCHIDRKIEGQDKCLECKFAMFARDNWGEEESDIVPMPYILQVQHQLAVTGYNEADLAVLIGGYDFRVYNFKRDEGLINKIETEIDIFWSHVENKTSPPLINRKDVELMYPYTIGKLINADDRVYKIYNQLRAHKQIIKENETFQKELSTELTLFIKQYDGLVYNDKLLATYKADIRGVRSLRIKE